MRGWHCAVASIPWLLTFCASVLLFLYLRSVGFSCFVSSRPTPYCRDGSFDSILRKVYILVKTDGPNLKAAPWYSSGGKAAWIRNPFAIRVVLDVPTCWSKIAQKPAFYSNFGIKSVL
jgi:hypothetical protein